MIISSCKTQLVRLQELPRFNYKTSLLDTLISLFFVLCSFLFLISIQLFTKTGFHTKEKNQQSRQFSQLSETLNDLVFGNFTNESAMRNESLEPQASGLYDNVEKRGVVRMVHVKIKS